MPKKAIKGRGSSSNPRNRFEEIEVVEDEFSEPGEQERPKTQYFRDRSRSFITYNQSPDVPFDAGINPYRGCEHGCIYCYARPTHEYLGFSSGLDFESRIMVKEDGPDLLRKELSSRKWKPQVLAMSGVTDPYQPIERKMKITRRCLEVLAEFRNPVGIITKNHLVTRDIDVLSRLAECDAASVHVSITTLDFKLSRAMEPRTSIPEKRLEAIHALSEAGIPVGVMVAPVIPGLTDQEIPNILKAAAEAGAGTAGTIMLRLPHAVAPLFEQWLEEHVPLRKEKVLSWIRHIRGGNLTDGRFTSRMQGSGFYADQVKMMFEKASHRYGLDEDRGGGRSVEAFRRVEKNQLSLL